MEFSSLRFLDLDVSLMLADQVRLSQENKARTFHYNLYSFESVFKSTIPGYYYRDHNIICRVLTGLSRYWGDFWDEELSGKTTMTKLSPINRRIILYEQELKNMMDRRNPNT